MDWIKRSCDWLMQAIFCSLLIVALGWLTWATRLTAHAQGPESPTNTYKGTFALELSADPIYTLQLEGEKIATYDPKKKALSISDKTFGLWVESHCVAVLNEAHAEAIPMGNLMSTTPIYQREIDKDGKEIVRMSELTLKLRCAAEREQP